MDQRDRKGAFISGGARKSRLKPLTQTNQEERRPLLTGLTSSGHFIRHSQLQLTQSNTSVLRHQGCFVQPVLIQLYDRVEINISLFYYETETARHSTQARNILIPGKLCLTYEIKRVTVIGRCVSARIYLFCEHFVLEHQSLFLLLLFCS